MQTRVYQAGSVVYFAGDKSDRVYILKEGKAQSIFLSEETGYEAREAINVGEFFGVKSLLGDYPQEDTVQCLSDCVVIIITYEEFENLVAKNKSIIIKMLRVFSNQLRRLNKKVNKLVEKAEDEEETNQLEGLYNIGEFYFKNHPLNKKDPIYFHYSRQDREMLTADVRYLNKDNFGAGKIAVFNIVMDGIHAYKKY